MKLTNGEIFNAKEPLGKLLTERMPVKASYNVAKLANKINDQYKIIDQVRLGLINKYGEPDPAMPKRKVVNQTSENFQKFVEDMNELMMQEVEIVFDEIVLPEDMEIEPSTLMALYKFIKVG